MGNLIRTDFKRIFSDRLFLVTCIICGALGFIQPVFSKLVFMLAGTNAEIMGLYVSAKQLLFGAFLPGSNAGLVAPILLAIILCKDFSYGTVRNKIIGGYSRTQIFLSMLITAFTTICCVIFFHALVTVSLALPLFEYQSTPFGGADLGYLFASLGFEIAVYLFVAAVVCFFCAVMKNTGVAVVMYVAVNMVFTLFGSITMLGMLAFASDPANEGVYNALRILSNANPFTTSLIGGGTSYSGEDVLALLLPTLLGGGLFAFFGAYLFNKRDLK